MDKTLYYKKLSEAEFLGIISEFDFVDPEINKDVTDDIHIGESKYK